MDVAATGLPELFVICGHFFVWRFFLLWAARCLCCGSHACCTFTLDASGRAESATSIFCRRTIRIGNTHSSTLCTVCRHGTDRLLEYSYSYDSYHVLFCIDVSCTFDWRALC